jgi:hypothetical protein
MGADWNQHSRLIKKNISEIIKPAFEPQTTRTLPPRAAPLFRQPRNRSNLSLLHRFTPHLGDLERAAG